METIAKNFPYFLFIYAGIRMTIDLIIGSLNLYKMTFQNSRGSDPNLPIKILAFFLAISALFVWLSVGLMVN